MKMTKKLISSITLETSVEKNSNKSRSDQRNVTIRELSTFTNMLSEMHEKIYE